MVKIVKIVISVGDRIIDYGIWTENPCHIIRTLGTQSVKVNVQRAVLLIDSNFI